MSCLHKYWLKEFFKFFSIIQLLILVLFVFIDYLSRMERFLNSDISLIGALGYVVLKVPFMFVQLTPASILLATITVFGLMNRSNELLAIKSSGISLYFLVKPALLVGVIFAMLMFFLGETIIPVTMTKSNYIKYNVIKKRHDIYSAKKDIWIKSKNKLVHINFYDPANQILAGVTITSLGENFRIESRIDAKKGYFKQENWVFENIIEQIHAKDSMDYDVKSYDEKIIPLTFKPEDLGEITKKSEEMSFFELKKYVTKVEEEGYDATTYKVDLNGKIAFPFICIIMVLTGAATGMRSFAKDNIPVAIAIGVVISFMYWVMYGFCLSMGYGTILPPVISAWTANLFFLALSALYLINTE
ncbi:LPS export ABC transporter permease LptG [Desulfobacula sp.]|uniref:LPS export ABC transporter permease LptG n=1 Tax=Desulfobacula sp. TaxID=2593537 RepID=UPI0025C1D199|nr:LPS export ABC transporter permease LptG [Desulfobacula sp.]MBC2703073.1 LPS export ABC transporter permease LptG [Desulfobacula sp.]